MTGRSSTGFFTKSLHLVPPSQGTASGRWVTWLGSLGANSSFHFRFLYKISTSNSASQGTAPGRWVTWLGSLGANPRLYKFHAIYCSRSRVPNLRPQCLRFSVLISAGYSHGVTAACRCFNSWCGAVIILHFSFAWCLSFVGRSDWLPLVIKPSGNRILTLMVGGGNWTEIPSLEGSDWPLYEGREALSAQVGNNLSGNCAFLKGKHGFFWRIRNWMPLMSVSESFASPICLMFVWNAGEDE